MKEKKKLYICAAFHPEAGTVGSSDMPPAPPGEPTCVKNRCMHGKPHEHIPDRCWFLLARGQKIGCKCVELV
jgi:hypothetical protein